MVLSDECRVFFKFLFAKFQKRNNIFIIAFMVEIAAPLSRLAMTAQCRPQGNYLHSLRTPPFGPEPFGNELKAELLMAEGRSLR